MILLWLHLLANMCMEAQSCVLTNVQKGLLANLEEKGIKIPWAELFLLGLPFCKGWIQPAFSQNLTQFSSVSPFYHPRLSFILVSRSPAQLFCCSKRTFDFFGVFFFRWNLLFISLGVLIASLWTQQKAILRPGAKYSLNLHLCHNYLPNWTQPIILAFQIAQHTLTDSKKQETN